MLLLLAPSWKQPALESFTCRGSERARDLPTVTQQAAGSTGIQATWLLSPPSLARQGLGLSSGLAIVWPGKG